MQSSMGVADEHGKKDRETREREHAAKEARRNERLGALEFPWPEPQCRCGGRPSFQTKWEQGYQHRPDGCQALAYSRHLQNAKAAEGDCADGVLFRKAKGIDAVPEEPPPAGVGAHESELEAFQPDAEWDLLAGDADTEDEGEPVGQADGEPQDSGEAPSEIVLCSLH